jgi:membrane protein implicated in regulation of membrane protease activity
VSVLVALTVGLVWWISAWAFGIKAFDAFLLTMFLVVAAAAYMLIKPFLDQMLGREAASGEERGVGM